MNIAVLEQDAAFAFLSAEVTLVAPINAPASRRNG